MMKSNPNLNRIFHYTFKCNLHFKFFQKVLLKQIKNSSRLERMNLKRKNHCHLKFLNAEIKITIHWKQLKKIKLSSFYNSKQTRIFFLIHF